MAEKKYLKKSVNKKLREKIYQIIRIKVNWEFFFPIFVYHFIVLSKALL